MRIGRRRRRITHVQIGLIALSAILFALGLSNWVRMGMALWYAARLPDLPMTVTWSYLAAMGGVWGTVFLVCGVSLVRPLPWARWATLATVTAYEVHVWLNHLIFDASDYARRTRLRDLLLTLALLALVWGSLSLRIVRRVFEGSAPVLRGK